MDAKKIKDTLEKSRNQALKQLHDLRDELNGIDDEIHWIDHAPLPLDDALAAIDRFITLHADGSSRAKAFFYQTPLQGLGPFDATVQIDCESTVIENGRIFGGAGAAHLAGVLIPLIGSSTVQRLLHDMARREAEHIESGPPLAERQELKASLQQRKYALEVEEETLICSAEALGMDGFYRRSDVNPEVVLMMEVSDADR
ncbi:hypothetical protein [Methylomicrobium sp. Wu6]|uniref:hypothetical protein n=1 Tax=Methylomicrobium sp. Wu6 TaxID=3107928 RepID=UPI002DD697D6|nr:hypothetical protein [Methylomicrobium sp. Wu6]MEC4747419.1 hypothetical protein [Methylomicrobium sp. Wu6]